MASFVATSWCQNWKKLYRGINNSEEWRITAVHDNQHISPTKRKAMGSLPEDKSWWMKLKGRSPSHQLTWVVNDLSQWGGVLLLGGCSWRGWWVTQPNPFLLYFCLKSRSPRIRKRSLSHPIPTQTTPNFSQYSHQDPVMFLLLLFPLTHLDQCLSCIWNLRSCKPFSLSIFKYIFFLPFMKLHFSIFDSIYFIPLVCLLVRKLISLYIIYKQLSRNRFD